MITIWVYLVSIGFRFWADLESDMGHYWGCSTVSLGLVIVVIGCGLGVY